jgi:hypothetical protein
VGTIARGFGGDTLHKRTPGPEIGLGIQPEGKSGQALKKLTTVTIPNLNAIDS